MVLTSIIIVYWSFFQCFAFSNLVLVKTRWLKSNPIRQLPTSPSCGLGSNNLFYYTTHQTRNNLHFPLQQTPASELIHSALQLKRGCWGASFRYGVYFMVILLLSRLALLFFSESGCWGKLITISNESVEKLSTAHDAHTSHHHLT